jgi:hypothetical protein
MGKERLEEGSPIQEDPGGIDDVFLNKGAQL